METEGKKQHFEGHVFDEVVFDDSIIEFVTLKKKLADYFDEKNTEDIFDYIPPQKTNQIFTPKGGLTVRENLQLLCRRCNWIKSDHEDDLPLASREVSEDILPGVVREGDKITVTLGDETKRFTITADRKRRGGMTFEIGGHTYAYEFSKGKLAVMK